MKILLSSLLLLALLVSVSAFIHKRKKEGVKGWKTALTSICFYAIAVLNLVAYWLDGLGIFSWGLTIVLLILGAYFTRYLPVASQSTA
ncbi:hypothetical protein GLV98_11015 [Halobacillus litoralis]|uniref:Uncharacterized protein n=1 Tax=Halobacillus litoralis TaxID=45668 RepID=A0A845EFM5_9BACI|nr:hypothetical protein [Halobacillus litoralis]MYL50018.1 hypothetical protein [Halobacillus litoralis]